MARIADNQLPSLNQVAAGIKAQACAPAAPSAPAPAPSPSGSLSSDARRVKSGTDILDVAGLDLCGIILPGDLAESGSRSGTSGSAGGRRAETEIETEAFPTLGDFADNGNTQTTSGTAGPSQPRPRPRPGAGAQAQSGQA